jgi:hypothetical protein
MNDELPGIDGKIVDCFTVGKLYLSICLKGLKKTTKNLIRTAGRLTGIKTDVKEIEYEGLSEVLWTAYLSSESLKTHTHIRF